MDRKAAAGGLALLALLVFTLCSCTDSSAHRAQTPKQDAEAKPLPSPTSFESDRHSYRLDLPTGWGVAEYEGTWTSFEQIRPGGEVPGEDVVSASDVQAFVVAIRWLSPTARHPPSG